MRGWVLGGTELGLTYIFGFMSYLHDVNDHLLELCFGVSGQQVVHRRSGAARLSADREMSGTRVCRGGFEGTGGVHGLFRPQPPGQLPGTEDNV